MSRCRADLRVRICALALSLVFGVALASPGRASPFEAWAAVVVAGDATGSLGGPTEAFDNARRDIARAFADLGVAPDKIAQFSARPEVERTAKLQKVSARAVYETLGTLAADATGCLVYVTSHGLPEGVLLNDEIVPPQIFGLMLDRSCGTKPTVVVISACYSGVFVPALAKPNRMILTAARPDRTSFGCGEADTYPYFDACFLSALNEVSDFIALGHHVGGCVRDREAEAGLAPPSEPQVWIGPQLRPVLPLLTFSAPQSR